MTQPVFTPRKSTVERDTSETGVRVILNLDGSGNHSIRTGIGFLDHMLSLLARHSGMDLDITCDGDLEVDDHHSAEDVGISLGAAIAEALGDKSYINRYGHSYVPMDEALARCVVDLSGRFAFHYSAAFRRDQVGDLSTEMIRHFWYSLAEQARCNLHIDVLHGENDHHIAEAIFKAAARALKNAIRRDPEGRRMPSTKEVL